MSPKIDAPGSGVRDYIDDVQEQWERMLPGIGTEPAAVVGRVRRLAQIIAMRSDAVLGAHGITRSEFDILSALARNGRPMTPTELATELLVSGAGTTKRIRKLVDTGLVRRDANPEDGRGALVRMTEKGRELLPPILQAIIAFEDGFLTFLPASDREVLAGYLRTMLVNIEEG